MSPALRLAAALLTVMCLTTGCWDFRGLDQRGLAIMAAIDRKAGNRWRLCLQLSLARTDPGQMRAQSGGQTGTGGIGFRVMCQEGSTLRQALERMRGELSRELDVTFIDTVVIGERAAADLGQLDWVIRSIRVPVTGFAGVARGVAEPVVKAQTPGLNPPGLYTLQGFSGGWTRSPAAVRTPLWVLFNRNFYTPLEDPYVPVTTSRKYGLNWDGMAVFRQRALVGFLTPDEASWFNIAREERFEYTVAAPIPGRRRAAASVHVQRGKVRRWVTLEGGRPVLHVKVQASGDLRELTGMRITDVPSQNQVQGALAAEMARQIDGLLAHLQRLGSDPVGFGELLRRRAPYWPGVQSGKAWHAAYRQARRDVTAQVTLLSTGGKR